MYAARFPLTLSSSKGLRSIRLVFPLSPNLNTMAYVDQISSTVRESIGTMLRCSTYYYWYHLGEAHAIRQMLGHTDLPQFVGDMSAALYHPEGSG